MKREGYGPARADILPADQTYAADELPDPRRLVAAFGQAVRRAGGRPGTGWLYGALHSECCPETSLIDLHWHILAAGSCLGALEALRTRRRYTAPHAVRLTRAPLTNLPGPLTYVRQSWSPARDRRLKHPPRRRMPEPAHSLMLLWLDRYSPGAFELMIGLRVVSGKLMPRA